MRELPVLTAFYLDIDGSRTNDDPLSSDADLRVLSLSHGRLTPAFAPGVTEYTASLSSDPGAVTITAAANDTAARVLIVAETQRAGGRVSAASGIIALAEGLNTVRVTVTAEDGTVRAYTLHITLDTASAETSILGDALAGQARSLLGDVNDVIGGGSKATSVAGGSAAAAPYGDAGIGLAGGTTPPLGAADSFGPGANSFGSGPASQPTVRAPVPSAFMEAPAHRQKSLFRALADARSACRCPVWRKPRARAARPRRRGSHWGPLRRSSSPGGSDNRHDGELRSLYLGVDGSFGAGGLAGAAVSRTDGETGYAYGAAEGRLETSLRSLYPYLRGASGRFAYWGIGGIGRGDAAWMRAGRGDRYEGDLEMRLGAVGGEFALTAWGATRLALVGDAGQAGLDIVADGGPLAGLSSSVSRARLGLELSRRTSGDDAGAWTVSGGFRTRYDGGDGLSGPVGVTAAAATPGRLELRSARRLLAATRARGRLRRRKPGRACA